MFLGENKNKVGRSKQELILTWLSFGCAIGIFPFIIIRALALEWPNALFNLLLVSIFIANGLYVFFTRKVQAARMAFAVIILFANIVGFLVLGVSQMLWSYPALVAIFFTVKPKTAAILCGVCVVIMGAISYPQLEVFRFVTYIISLSFTCIFVFFFANLTRQQYKAISNLSRRDSLTDLLNRRAFDEHLEEVQGLVREHQRTCMILFDIDHFKQVNDDFGHWVGDQVLIELAEVVGRRVRKLDKLYRTGGEEFAVILNTIQDDEALKIAENIRIIVKNSMFSDEHKITISLGIAEYLENESKSDWFERCDSALYSAKNKGRDQSVVAKAS